MPTPEEMVASMTAAKAELESKVEVKDEPKKEEASSTVVTDKALIEAALADTVEPTKQELLLAEIAKIHAQYPTRSDIPIGHDYWGLCNQLSSLRNQ